MHSIVFRRHDVARRTRRGQIEHCSQSWFPGAQFESPRRASGSALRRKVECWLRVKWWRECCKAPEGCEHRQARPASAASYALTAKCPASHQLGDSTSIDCRTRQVRGWRQKSVNLVNRG